MSSITVVIASLCSAAGAFALAYGIYSARLREMRQRLDHVSRIGAHTSEMLMQARRQVEALQHEVATMRRMRHITHPVREQCATKAQSAREDSVIVSGTGFAETQMRA